MLDIYTCIISCIVFSNLVLNLYFRDTNTWNSCDVHYLEYMIFVDPPCYFILWSRVLLILWLCYMTVTHPGHFLFIKYMSHHAWTVLVHDLLFRLFVLLLLLLVLDTTNHIVFIISMPYLYYFYIFIFSLLLFFSLRVLLPVRFDGSLLFFSI